MKASKFDIGEMVRPSLVGIRPYASAKDEFKDFEQDLIFLDANENPFENGMNRYPDPHQEKLKSCIARIKKAPVENILLGNGSDEVLDMIYRVFFEPGKDNIIINVPTFGMFEVLSRINHIESRKVPLTDDFQLDVAEIRGRIDAYTKAVFVCSPNNPTGNLMRQEDLLALLQLPLFVVVDEAYIDFAPGKSLLSLLGEHKNLIITQTFSKAYGLAGIRLGMCFADAEVIGWLKKVKMPYNVNVLTQRKALDYLNQEEVYQREVAAILNQRNLLVEALRGIDFIDEIFDSSSNFLLVRVDDADRRYKELIDLGFVVRNRSREPKCENCLRITVGTENENRNLIRAMEALEHKSKEL